MNFRTSAKFTPVSISRLMQTQVPKMVAAIEQGCEAVVTEAEAIVPVDTGELRESIHVASVSLIGTTVQGSVVADAPHAAYVEYGTGFRGQASAGAGVGPYSESWPGQAAQPYMRPALDSSRGEILAAFRKNGFKV